MIKWMFAKAGKLSGKGGAAPDYEKAKIQAASADPAERARLASMSQLQPEFLYYFASDKSPEVRREVAKNEGTPIQADIILARDPDELVRQELGGKIARLMPDLSFEENEKLASMVLEVVETLSQDAAPVARSVVAESIKARDDIPKRIVDRLAQDTEAVVSVPVIQFSPLLTDDDLLALIDIGRSGSLLAMARRAFLGEGVSQKIA